jgi:hypothetical protein
LDDLPNSSEPLDQLEAIVQNYSDLAIPLFRDLISSLRQGITQFNTETPTLTENDDVIINELHRHLNDLFTNLRLSGRSLYDMMRYVERDS